jgi:hypothetical protein
MFFFEMDLVGEGKEQVTGLHLVAYEIYPVTIAAVLDQEEKVVVFTVGQEEV